MIDADDVQLQIKKKARRRLVGAVAFAALAALVLPMVMDQEPVPPAQEVEIRIPGQDGKPFQPNTAAAALPPVEATPAPEQTPNAPAVVAVPGPAQPAAAVVQEKPVPLQPVARVIEKTPTQGESKPEAKPAKPEVKPEPKIEPKPKAEPKPEPKSAKSDSTEAQRAAAILAGKPSETAAGGNGPHVILIGAFANEANVKNIKSKLGELGIKVYTEPLDSPQGRKIRVRAGPFSSRDAADKALEKMKRIGVSGVVTSK